MREKVFETMSDNRLIFMFSLSSVISLLLESLASVVDTAFVGHLPNQGIEGLTAMGLIGPVLTVLIAAQLLFGVSTSILIGKGLGMGNNRLVNQSFKIGIYASLIFSGLISAAIYCGKDQILISLGAQGAVAELAWDYLSIILVSNVFSSVGYTLINNIRAFGFPKIEIYIAVTALVVNLILNWTFTFGLGMGIKGIAWATLVGEVFCLIVAVMFFWYKKLWFVSMEGDIQEYGRILWSLTKMGMVQFSMQFLIFITGILINQRILYYGTSIDVGIWALANRLSGVVLMPLIGLNQGIQSVLAYLEGKKEPKRTQAVVRKSVYCSLVYGVAITLFILVFTQEVLALFSNEGQYIQLAVVGTRIIFMTFPIVGIIYTLMTLLQVSNGEGWAIFIGLVRQIIGLVPIVFLLPCFIGQIGEGLPPLLGIYLAIPVVDLVTLVVAMIVFSGKRRS